MLNGVHVTPDPGVVKDGTWFKLRASDRKAKESTRFIRSCSIVYPNAFAFYVSGRSKDRHINGGQRRLDGSCRSLRADVDPT